MRDATLARWYRAFHGRAPRELAEVVSAPRELADLGPLVAVVYLRGDDDVREHVFAPSSRPALARDEGGALHILGGHFTVTERGITEMGHELAAYKSPHKAFTPAGVPVYGRRMPREGLAVVRQNPVEMLLDGGRAVWEQSGAVAVTTVTAGATVLVSDALMERLPIAEPWRAAVQFGGGVLPGVAVMAWAPDFGRGLIVGGFVGSVKRWVMSRGYDAIAARWLEKLAPRRAASGVNDNDLPFKVKVEARAE